MHVEMNDSDQVDQETVTPKCDQCGLSTRSWTIHFCYSCGRSCHLLCMRGSWVCEYKTWTCDDCAAAHRGGVKYEPCGMEASALSVRQERKCARIDDVSTQNGNQGGLADDLMSSQDESPMPPVDVVSSQESIPRDARDASVCLSSSRTYSLRSMGKHSQSRKGKQPNGSAFAQVETQSPALSVRKRKCESEGCLSSSSPF